MRDQLTDHRQHIRSHTCVEAIVLERFVPWNGFAGTGANLKATSMDRLRLESAVAEAHEIYSWPGAFTFRGCTAEGHKGFGTTRRTIGPQYASQMR